MGGCEVCFKWKIKHKTEGYDEIGKDKGIIIQLLILDLVLIMQRTQEKNQAESLSGINGEQA